MIDLPKDILIGKAPYTERRRQTAAPQLPPADRARRRRRSARRCALLKAAKRPVIYAGGGVINSGPEASRLLTEFVRMTGFPCTMTLMGLGAFPASDPQFLGMLGMHGTYEANLAMHGCDVMLNIGARFDDRVTGRLNAFAPDSKKIHIDIDPSSINKNVKVDVPIVGDAGAIAGGADRGLEGRRRRRRTARRWPPGGGRSMPGARKDCLRYAPGGQHHQAAARGAAALRDHPRDAAARPSSPPRSASTRCGRRSTSASRSRTAG